jgi:hypothetical protein
MKKLKIIGLTAVCTFVITLLFTLIIPDFIKQKTAGSLINNPEITQLLNGAEVENITYLGNNTYKIIANNKNYIAIKDYVSVMNYRWHLFGKINDGG